MTNARDHEFNGDRIEDSAGGDSENSSSISSGVETSTFGSARVSVESRGITLTERLTDILVEQGDGDLLLQQGDREGGVLQWLQALDMQVMGACRADERLKPLLKSNTSSGLAEDRLLAHLSQLFEPSEVGMLARCFCIPLVSIRVGKINKQGTLLCPTAIRGNLNLILLPTSDLRLSFIGDDGSTELLFTLSSKAQCSALTVEEITTDSSGRSFRIKTANSRDYFFWCAEKSKLLGIELLSKMNDILQKKPSIAELTGISKSRLDCFANHLRTYLLASNTRESSACSVAFSLSTTPDLSDRSSISKSLQSRDIGNQAVKSNSSYQGSLGPRSTSFKEGLARSSRNDAKEKLGRCGDSRLSAVDNWMIASSQNNDACNATQSENRELPEVKVIPMQPSSCLESLGSLAVSSALSSASDLPSTGPPVFSPYYCWCPQGTTNLQYASALPRYRTSPIDSPFLPPLSSLLSATKTTLLTPPPTLNVADIPTLDFPALLPDPLGRRPIPNSRKIPTFTPLMCDPIVHTPVIGIYSAGQGYLVSAGPAIASTIPPLHPNLAVNRIPGTDSLVEKGARETLRLLVSGTSQANSIATMGLVSLTASSIGEDAEKMNTSCGNLDALSDCLDSQLDGSSGLGGSSSDE